MPAEPADNGVVTAFPPATDKKPDQIPSPSLSPSGNTSAKSVSSASVYGATVLAAVQFVSRGLTFGLNQVLIRYISSDVFAAAVGLDLYAITVLYFAREGVRNASGRACELVRRPAGTDPATKDRESDRHPERNETIQVAVNLAYQSLLGGIFVTGLFALFFLFGPSDRGAGMTWPLVIYTGACLIELLGEPAFAAAQQKMFYGIRGSSEGAATIARCLTICGLVIWSSSRSNPDDPENNTGVGGVLAFALGQAVFAIVLSTSLWAMAWKKKSADEFSLLPVKIDSSTFEGDTFILSRFSTRLTSLSVMLTGQSVVKYLLTQGDNIVMTTFASAQDRAGFGLAANYGSLIARLVFQPIEESSRTLFSRLCAAPSSPDSVSKTDDTSRPSKMTDERETTPNPMIIQARSILNLILSLYHLIALLAITLGPPLSPLLLTLVAGRRWVSTGDGVAVTILQAYCYYIPLLAYNGITEAFVTAVAGSYDIAAQVTAMTVFFLVFAVTTVTVFGGWAGVAVSGGVGIVIANSVNMVLRLGWSCAFIAKFFNRRGVREYPFLDGLPRKETVACAVAVAALLRSALFQWTSDVSRVVETRILDLLIELAKMGAISGLLLVTILYLEREKLKQGYSIFKG